MTETHARTFESRGQAALALLEHRGRFHDRLRIHSALGRLGPAGPEAAHESKDRLPAA